MRTYAACAIIVQLRKSGNFILRVCVISSVLIQAGSERKQVRIIPNARFLVNRCPFRPSPSLAGQSRLSQWFQHVAGHSGPWLCKHLPGKTWPPLVVPTKTLTRLATSGMKTEDEADGCAALAVVTLEVVTATDVDVDASRPTAGENTDAAVIAARAMLVPDNSMAAHMGVEVEPGSPMALLYSTVSSLSLRV